MATFLGFSEAAAGALFPMVLPFFSVSFFKLAADFLEAGASFLGAFLAAAVFLGAFSSVFSVACLAAAFLVLSADFLAAFSSAFPALIYGTTTAGAGVSAGSADLGAFTCS